MPDQKDPKEPFVSQADRPEVKIDPDKPVSELRVRDLQSLLGANQPHKAQLDIKQIKPEKVEKFEKHEKLEKPEKFEKHEKLEKHEKNEVKEHKLEKIEIKEHKHEKLEIKEHKLEKQEFETIPQPVENGPEQSGTGLAQLVEHVGGLHKKVDDLANQIAELKKGK